MGQYLEGTTASAASQASRASIMVSRRSHGRAGRLEGGSSFYHSFYLEENRYSTVLMIVLLRFSGTCHFTWSYVFGALHQSPPPPRFNCPLSLGFQNACTALDAAPGQGQPFPGSTQRDAWLQHCTPEVIVRPFLEWRQPKTILFVNLAQTAFLNPFHTKHWTTVGSQRID